VKAAPLPPIVGAVPPNVSAPDGVQISGISVSGCPGLGFSQNDQGLTYMRATCLADEAPTPQQLEVLGRTLKSRGPESPPAGSASIAVISYRDASGRHTITLKDIWGGASSNLGGSGVVFLVYFKSFTKT
jgi:hypothetical protein